MTISPGLVSGNCMFNNRSWRLAKSLVTLANQVDQIAPQRSKTKGPDGTHGDRAHHQRTSDHNENSRGVVTALDLSHDPAGGCDSYALAEVLRQNKDPRIKYVISNQRIFYGPRSPSHGGDPSSLWKWGPADDHEKHIHISTGDSRYYDKEEPWNLAGFPSTQPGPVSRPTLEKGSTGPFVAQVQHTLGVPVDSDFGPITESAVKGYQAATGIAADGIVGPITWGKLDELDAKLAASHGPGLPAALVDEIELLAARSSLANYQFRDRGKAPLGFIAGMGCAFALAARWLTNPLSTDIVVTMQWADKMSVPAGNPETDALAWYAREFQNKGWQNTGGIDTLRHLFVLMIGLGMRESSGRYPEGRDTSASNVTADTAEAGVFQMSWNMKSADSAMAELFNSYWNDPVGFLDEFKPGVNLKSSDLTNYGGPQGASYQFLAKYCPAFACMTAAIGLRKRRAHWGPINRKEAELVTAADDYLRQVQIALNTQPQIASDTTVPLTVPPLDKAAPQPQGTTMQSLPINLDQVLSLARIFLNLSGGLLIGGGYISESGWAQASGAILTLVGTAWSMWQHTRTQTIAAAARLPEVKTVVATSEFANEGSLKDNPKVVSK